MENMAQQIKDLQTKCTKMTTIFNQTYCNDRPIMDNIPNSDFTKLEQQMINACIIYLQVFSLAETTNKFGDRFFDCAMQGTVDNKQQPHLWHYCTTKLTWPGRHQPSQRAWGTWKKYKSSFTAPNGTLWQALGTWNTTCHHIHQWHFTKSSQGIIHTTKNIQLLYSPTTSCTQHSTKYHICPVHTPVHTALHIL
jgi:hypothetical protein